MISFHNQGLQKIENQWKFEEKFRNYPVICVSWYGAYEYCRWLQSKTDKMYQLPNENYWEYAARGGNKNNNFEYAGSNNIDEVCWYRENSANKEKFHPEFGTHNVGRKKSNELELYDMSGNVWEWCNNKKGGWHCVTRGGSWSSNFMNCEVSFQQTDSPWAKRDNVGFRPIIL